jgi:hypothetical protein
MYLRTTRQRRKHGPDAIYYQLAENYYHKERRRSVTRVIYTFGRADQVDPEALRRLAQSILRVANDDRIDLPARKFPPDVGIDDIEQVYAYGVLYAAHALWEELGIGALLREKMQQDSCEAPHDTALFAMTANRLARPASKLACYAHWLADEVNWPEAKTLGAGTPLPGHGFPAGAYRGARTSDFLSHGRSVERRCGLDLLGHHHPLL